MEAYDSYEYAGVTVEIVQDDDPSSPQDHDNAGTLYSWTRDFSGDEEIREPDGEVLCPTCQGEGMVPTQYRPGMDWSDCLRCKGDGTLVVSLGEWFAEHFGAALTVPLRFSDERYHARIYERDDEDANCALVFTQKEIDHEWSGHVEAYEVPVWRSVRDEDGQWKSVPDGTGESGARPYAKARIEELDQYLQGNVWLVLIRHEGEIPESCGGFIGEPDAEWIREEANGMAECAAEGLREEAEEAAEWAARGVVTIKKGR